MQDPIAIVGAARTSMGAFTGDFADLVAHDFGGAAIRVAVERAGVALQRHGKKRGLAALCIGGGEATAMAIERL